MSRTRCREVASLSGNSELSQWASSDLVWDGVHSVEPCGEREVFDLRIPGINCFITNGLVAHNSGNLEADADTVMLLHRQDSAPGVIEVIVAKQRNGPTGEVTLAFRKESMRFEDYAPGTPFESTYA